MARKRPSPVARRVVRVKAHKRSLPGTAYARSEIEVQRRIQRYMAIVQERIIEGPPIIRSKDVKRVTNHGLQGDF